MAAFFSLKLILLYNDLSAVERDPGGWYFSSLVDLVGCSLVDCSLVDISSDALLGLLISGVICGLVGGPLA